MSTEAQAPPAPPRLGARLSGVATALGFASGLPYSLLIGAVGVWFTAAHLSFSAIGALSWIGLFYAFKFIWAPALDGLAPPFARSLGARRAWMALCQIVIAACIVGMALADPRTNILLFTAFAVVAGFASASQDVVIDAWRIETAPDAHALDKMTVQYQLGYRLASITAGAVALLLSDIFKTPGDDAAAWPGIFVGLGVVMACALLATWLAPAGVFRSMERSGEISAEARAIRARAAWPTAAGWAVSGAALLGLMFLSLSDPSNKAIGALRDQATILILALTIGAPIALSFWLAKKPGLIEAPTDPAHFADVLFARVLAPLADVVRRYWLWSLPILGLAMTYRIADSIWGSFAQPYYLSILKASPSDLAVVQKLVGVLATMAGIALGGLGVAWLGRMPALLIGAVLAAVTNLLYVDLSFGGHAIDAFLGATGLGPAFDWLLGTFVGALRAAGATVVLANVHLGPDLTRLAAAITLENLAGGFASAVHLVWLSSIVNKRYAAVQYALLSSLALLLGVIFRPAIGDYVDAGKAGGLAAQAARFADVFAFSAWVGVVAIALCLVEWWRQAKGPPERS